MSSTEPEQGSRENTEAVEMLTYGRGLAFQLRDLLLDDDQIPVSGERLMLAEDLLHKIHGSFTNTISALDRSNSGGSPDQNNMAESSETCRPRSAPASRRKGREISESQSWTEISSSLVHDGHSWRKYGQKSILDAKHSRSYFKCTHKDQYNCPAKKHVQQIQDDPLTFRTVYTFRHTCISMTSIITASQMLDLGSTSAAVQPADMNQRSSSSTFILNFQSSNQQTDHNNYSINDLMKQEYTTLNEQTTEHHLQSVQQMIPSSSNNNMGSSSSDVGGGVLKHYIEGFMNYSTDQQSPYSSHNPDTEDRWF